MTIRLNKVTRDLNVGITTVVDFLQKKGYTVEANPNTKITEEQYAALIKEFSKDKDLKIESEKIIQERQNKERNKVSVSIEDIHPELKKPEVIETVVPEDVRPKFKPVGKIDLDGLKKKKNRLWLSLLKCLWLKKDQLSQNLRINKLRWQNRTLKLKRLLYNNLR